MIITQEITPKQFYQGLINIKDENHNPLFSLDFCKQSTPLINEINALKKETNACVLAHSYVTADIIYGVSDFVGDSYELSKKAKESTADTIIFAGVKFMGETAKLLCPDKNVLVPATDPGCTLADAINAEDVALLKKQNPDFTFVCYINTTAEIKAVCDVCVTSANVYKVVEKIPNNKIFFLPDRLMALNLIQYCQNNQIEKTIKYADGTCYLHEEYNPQVIKSEKQKYPDAKVLCHPECSPEVCAECDYVGSTSQILSYVKNSSVRKYLILTDSGITARIQHDYPEKEIIGSASGCKYMKSNTLADILRVLKDPLPEDYIHVSPAIRNQALACINAMFTYVD